MGLQFLLWPDIGSFMSRNQLPIKRVLTDLLGQTVELNEKYNYDQYFNGNALH
jgi:hypothetical protein